MAVPTVYSRLIQAWQAMTPEQKEEATKACSRFRLMVSGSMALPDSVMRQWKEVSGHMLLERYGMTEIGMCLGNPYKPEQARVPGTVGFPFPGVHVRVVDENEQTVPPGTPGELRVKGPTVFKEYWQRPEATAKEFDKDGWFKTGDIVQCSPDGRYSILGRASMDILKSRGYKISALDVERVFSDHAAVTRCAVVGLPDETVGQRIAIAIVCKSAAPAPTLEQLREWAHDKLPPYKLPERLLVVDELPMNAMMKTNKKELLKWFEAPPSA